jgi:ATP-dependent protease ClpP protease subunit
MFKAFLVLFMFSVCAEAKNIVLSKSNTLSIRGPVTQDSVAAWSAQLAKMHLARTTAHTTIYMVMDTPGGDVDAGLSFINFARTVPNIETVTMFAASMGSGIVESLPGRRHITPDGLLMFHRAHVGLEGQIGSGEFESRLEMIKKTVSVLENANASRMRMTKADYQAAVKDEFWLLGDDAIKANAADSIDTISCDNELLQAAVVETVSFMGLNLKVEFASCPLLRTPRVSKADELTYKAYVKYYSK